MKNNNCTGMNEAIQTHNKHLVFNRYEWETMGWFTQDELDKATYDATRNGFIGIHFGNDCYLTTFIQTA